MVRIAVGKWRPVESGPMQVVSGAMGREKIHYEAPCASKLDHEIDIFLDWFNNSKGIDPVIKAGVAHFWFVTIHPFEDGNGRIARAIADMCLSRADEMPERFYSMSSQIKDERAKYYHMLEESQECNLDITKWLEWFVECFDRSIKNADKILNKIIIKANLWRKLSSYSINERQKKTLNILTDNFEGKLTSSKYAKLNKCSQDTAIRDIKTLIEYGVISQGEKSGRSTSYSLILG
jgi:Fic family protein